MSPRMVRVFSMFTVMFGAQKMSAVYEGMNHDAVAEIWDGQLRGFDDQTVNRAMQAVMDSDGAWPPTLPAFKGICRQFIQDAPIALPAPREPIPAAAAAAMHQAGHKEPPTDPLRWARNPKSLVALRMLRTGVERGENRHLRDILAELASKPSGVTNADVRRALGGQA